MSHETDLVAKAQNRSAAFGVIGLGYVGLPLAVELARAGYRVVGFDLSSDVVSAVNMGKSHVQDVPSDVLAPLVEAGG
jgi:UDP-N-acetyl-D-glucosamine dehydrogenase